MPFDATHPAPCLLNGKTVEHLHAVADLVAPAWELDPVWGTWRPTEPPLYGPDSFSVGAPR